MNTNIVFGGSMQLQKKMLLPMMPMDGSSCPKKNSPYPYSFQDLPGPESQERVS